MKTNITNKLLTMLFLLTLSMGLFAQRHRATVNREISNETTDATNALVPHCTFELGWEQSQNEFWLPVEQQIIGSAVSCNSNSMYSLVDLSVQWRRFKLYNYTKTYFNKDRSIYFNPLTMDFNIGIVYGFKSIPLSIYYEHDCQHDIEVRQFSSYYDRVGVHIKLF